MRILNYINFGYKGTNEHRHYRKYRNYALTKIEFKAKNTEYGVALQSIISLVAYIHLHVHR